VRVGSPLATLAILATLAVFVGACGGAATPASYPVSPGTGKLTWTSVADMTPFSEGTVQAAIAFGSGLVAAGTVPEGKTVHAAAWTSTDGKAWTRSTDDPTFGGSAAFTMLATAGSTLVGAGCTEGPEGCGLAGVLFWTTQTGRTWSASTIEPTTVACAPDTTNCNYAGLAVGPTGLVAVGFDHSAGFGGTVPADASVAVSKDGTAWSIDPLDAAFKAATMGGVAAAAGGFVAVGATSDLVPVVWTSTDGRTWTRPSPSGLSTSAELRSIVTGTQGLVAVGGDGSRAASWTSKDGATWVEGPDAPALAGGSMLQVHSTSTGLVALGTVNGGGAAWLSADGSTWTKLDPGPAFQGAQVTAAAGIGSRLVLFGKSAAGHLIEVIGAP
jgi:hypothetical protein